MASLHDVVFDCRHPGSQARFWAAALDGYRVAPYDDVEVQRLRAAGIDDPEDDPSVLVEPETGVRPRFWFTSVPEPRSAKNRLHVDLRADDRQAEVTRLVNLGATVLAVYDRWTTLADPEGNEFCLRD
jgi:hypothetical protein